MDRPRTSHNASKKAVEVVYFLIVDISFRLARTGKINLYIFEQSTRSWTLLGFLRFLLLSEWVGAEEDKQVTYLMILRDWLSRVGPFVKATKVRSDDI